MSAHHLLALSAATALFVTVSQAGLGQELKNKPLAVTTPDGLSISAQEWGNPNGPGIVFIHGFSQSNLSWMRQTHSDLTKEFHIVTYDLRGHGNSEKPLEAARYRDGKAWADEVQAVIDAAGLKRPVLVGWSYAGRVISDYVTYRGADGISGIDFVDASIKFVPEFVGDNLKNLPLMASEDLLTNITATRTFLHDCFSKQRRRLRDYAGLQHDGAAQGACRAVRSATRRHRCHVEAHHPGAGDPRRRGQERQARHGEIHRLRHPQRQTLSLRRHRPLAIL